MLVYFRHPSGRRPAVLPFPKRAIIARHHPRGYLISSPKDHVTDRRGGGKITKEAESMGISAIRMATTYQDVREEIFYCVKGQTSREVFRLHVFGKKKAPRD